MIFDSVKSTSSKSIGDLFYFPSYYVVFLENCPQIQENGR